MYCSNCGTEVAEGQAVCGSCFFTIKKTVSSSASSAPSEGFGYTLINSTGKSRITAMVIAWFLGAFGGHWFYLGNTRRGVFTLLFSLTGFILIVPLLITGILAIIDLFKLGSLQDVEAFDAFCETAEEAVQ